MKTCEKCGGVTLVMNTGEVYSANTPFCNCKPETFDWKQAMRLFADGVEIERFQLENNHWTYVGWSYQIIMFHQGDKYRIKPTPPPDVVTCLNIYDGQQSSLWHKSENEADECSVPGRIGIIKKTTNPTKKTVVEYIPKEK